MSFLSHHMTSMTDNTNPFSPTTLRDFVFNDNVSRQTLEAIVNSVLPFPYMGKCGILLWGVNGTGKTTLATLLPSLLEQTAKLLPSKRTNHFRSDVFWEVTPCRTGNNSVALLNTVDARCKDFKAWCASGWHYEVLDEVDMLTEQAQLSFKATMTHARNTIFILTTNHINMIDRGIKDRCFLIEMNQPSPADMLPFANRILEKMGVDEQRVPDAVILNLAAASRGSLRDFSTAVTLRGIHAGGSVPTA
jgi:DNA polymerase III delta prime subunit